MTECSYPAAKLCPVTDSTGAVILYDIFIAGKWIGSRRTLAQAMDELRQRKWPSAVIGIPTKAKSKELSNEERHA